MCEQPARVDNPDPALPVQGSPRRVRCLNPFRWLEVVGKGEVTPCCVSWFKGSLGSLRENSMAEIWNGPRMREVREAMYEGGAWWKFCNAQTCPQIKNNTWVNLDELTPETPDLAPITAEMLDEIRQGHTTLSTGPAQIGVSCESQCNLRCIMCHTRTHPEHDGEVLRKTFDGIRSFLPHVRRIKLMGDGEVFAVPEAREFLFQFDPATAPQTSFLLHTNGMLLTPAMWDRIKHLRIDWLVMSLDAATAATYEKIRRGGKWATLMRNLDFLMEQQRAGLIRELHVNMCVMRSNHREMVLFAQLARRLGVTLAYFMPILGDFGTEQIFDRRDVGCLKRVRAQLNHPIMREPGIDLSSMVEWVDWQPTLKDYLRPMKRTVKRGLKRLLGRT